GCRPPYNDPDPSSDGAGERASHDWGGVKRTGYDTRRAGRGGIHGHYSAELAWGDQAGSNRRWRRRDGGDRGGRDMGRRVRLPSERYHLRDSTPRLAGGRGDGGLLPGLRGVAGSRGGFCRGDCALHLVADYGASMRWRAAASVIRAFSKLIQTWCSASMY